MVIRQSDKYMPELFYFIHLIWHLILSISYHNRFTLFARTASDHTKYLTFLFLSETSATRILFLNDRADEITQNYFFRLYMAYVHDAPRAFYLLSVGCHMIIPVA